MLQTVTNIAFTDFKQGLLFEAIDRSIAYIDRLNSSQAIDFLIVYSPTKLSDFLSPYWREFSITHFYAS